MERLSMMRLVRSYQVGEIGEPEFLARATVAAGPVAATSLLAIAQAAPGGKVPPVEDLEAGGGSAERAVPAGGLTAGSVEYSGEAGERLVGFLARPSGAERRPGVVVIQEWWGLNDHIRDVTCRFAHEGFVALAPDLYHGVVVTEPDEARKLVMELDMAQAVREIRQAIDFLQVRAFVAGRKVGIAGFCMGGRLVLQTARVEEDLGAAVAFYGSPLTPDEAYEVKAPLLGLYGAEDQGIPVERVEAMRAALDEAGIENEIRIYQGAGHAFFNDTRPSYHPEAAMDAWSRTLAWFRRFLSG